LVIAFNHQFYEVSRNVYMPQFLQECLPYVKLCMEHLNDKTVLQYQQEERSSIVHRVRGERCRIKDLRDASIGQELSTAEHSRKLREGYAEMYKIDQYYRCKT